MEAAMGRGERLRIDSQKQQLRVGRGVGDDGVVRTKERVATATAGFEDLDMFKEITFRVSNGHFR